MMGWKWHQLDHANHLQTAPHSREITTPVPHHSVLTGRTSSCQPTNSIKALKAHRRKQLHIEVKLVVTKLYNIHHHIHTSESNTLTDIL